MTDTNQSFVAQFKWRAFGELYAYTGTEGIDLRFPGQLFQEESGLHYNWFRQYDPSIGRYTQPDPLGLVDGPSRYAYVGSDPLQKIDPEGLLAAPSPAAQHESRRPGDGACRILVSEVIAYFGDVTTVSPTVGYGTIDLLGIREMVGVAP